MAVAEGPDLKRRTLLFSKSVIQFYVKLTRSTLDQTLGKQLLRSATSVGANYREACRSRSRQEFVAIMGISLKELEETSYWLELFDECLPSTDQEHLLYLTRETWELTAVFTSIIKSASSNLNSAKAGP